MNPIDGKYLFSVTKNDSKRYFLLYQTDTNGINVNKVTVDSFKICHHILAESLSEYRSLFTIMPKTSQESGRLEIQETKDSGKTYSTILNIDRELTVNHTFEYNIDSLFFTTYLSNNRVFLFDRMRNAIDTLFADDESFISDLQIIYIYNKFYIIADNLFLENTDRSDLTKWKAVNWQYPMLSFSSVIAKENTILSYYSDSLRSPGWYKFFCKSKTDVNDSEIKYFTNHFFASPPQAFAFG